MEDHGLVTERFLDHVMEERLSPTNFPSGAAIPHSMQMDALQSTGIAVCVADEPFDWGGQQVSLVAMIAVSGSSRDIFGESSTVSFPRPCSPGECGRLKDKGNSYAEFIECLLEIL